MNRTTKLILMFAPLALFFVGFALAVNDLRHPTLSTDQCTITGIAEAAQAHKGQGPYIYQHGDSVRNDVSLQCNRYGVLMLNDTQLLQTPIKSGHKASLSLKEYQYFPKRWQISVHTGKPKE